MQQHNSRYLALGVRSKGQNSTFLEHSHAYQLNGITMQQNGSIYFAHRPPSKGQTSIFSEHGHVAYQIKGNHECSNMVANSLPADTPTPSIRRV